MSYLFMEILPRLVSAPMRLSDLDALTESQISRLLAQAHTGREESNIPVDLLSKTLKPAAVLIPFLRLNHQWHLLFIHRAQIPNDPHSGQVAFPGGASDPADSGPEQTALREAREELGISPMDVNLLGCLNDFRTITSYRVTPVVGSLPWPYPIFLESTEVSRAFTIPLGWLANPENRQIQQRLLPPPYSPVPVIYYRSYDGEVLWGASAGFTLKLINILSEISLD